MEFSQQLLEFRASFNLSQQEAAEILESTQRMISLYERGAVIPRAKNLLFFNRKMKEYERSNK